MSEQKDPAYPPDPPYPSQPTAASYPQQQAYPPPPGYAPHGYPPQQGYPVQAGYPQQQQQQQQQQQHPQQGYTSQTYVPQAVYTPQGQVTIKTGAPQHQAMVRAEIRTEPNDYICFSIFVMLFCCMPLGIIALIKSMDVRSLVAVRDFEAAGRASHSAKNWNVAGLVSGLIIQVVAIIFIIIWVVVFGNAAVSSITSDLDTYHDSDYYG